MTSGEGLVYEDLFVWADTLLLASEIDRELIYQDEPQSKLSRPSSKAVVPSFFFFTLKVHTIQPRML